MSNTAEIRSSAKKGVKQKLDSIFGSFSAFSDFITKPDIKRSHIHGVVQQPVTPLIENLPTKSPIEEQINKSLHPGPSTSQVLESMKGIVEASPLSCLGSASPHFVEPAYTIKSTSDKKRSAPKDHINKREDNSKKRKIDVNSNGVKSASTPPGKRVEPSKVNIRELFGTTSDDDDENEPKSKDLAKEEIHTKSQINQTSKYEDKKKEKNTKPKESTKKLFLDKNKKKEDSLHTKSQMKTTTTINVASTKMNINEDLISTIPNNSPDSGISSMGISQSETKERMNEELALWPVERILGTFSHLEPLLSPLHFPDIVDTTTTQPQVTKVTKNSTVANAKWRFDLSLLPTTDRVRLTERWRNANHFNTDNKPEQTTETKNPQRNEPSTNKQNHKQFKDELNEELNINSPKVNASSSKDMREMEGVNKNEYKLSIKQMKKEPNDITPKSEEPVNNKETKITRTIHQGIATIIKASKKKEPIMPLAKETIEEPTERTNLFSLYQSQARNLKHKGDQETDKIEKALCYLESVVFFIMSSCVHNPNEVNASPYSLISETCNYLKITINAFLNSRTDFSSFASIRSRIKILSNLMQACFNYRMYDMRSEQAIKNYHQLYQYEKDNPPTQNGQKQGGAIGSNGATPSPASSTHSSNISAGPSPKDKISLPVKIYNIQSSQLKLLNTLMMAHKLWKDAIYIVSQENQQEFHTKLNELCGELTLSSDLKQLAEFLLTGVKWLRREYCWMKESGKN